MQPLESETIHAVFEVKAIKRTKLFGGMWQIRLRTYGGSVAELLLYWGDEECPFKLHDYYQTDDGVRGGWKLTRCPQEDIDLLNGQREEWEALPPAAKAKRTREMRKKLRLLNEDVEARRKRHRAEGKELQCLAIWIAPVIPGYKTSIKPIPCQFVEGHSGDHWNGRGMGQGYEWGDDDPDSFDPTHD